MLHALVEGKATAQEMAELAKKQLRKKIPERELALEGKVEEHHRFLLRVQLRRLQAVESWHSRATHSGEAQALCGAVHLVAGNTGHR